MTRRILFLCSGNYYRSRFAEILFNHLAQENNLDWTADSRGIVAQWSFNPGPIAEATRQGLAERRIPMPAPRYPLQLTAEDLARADCVIALHEEEHRPMMSNYFESWADQIEYWHVPDLGEMDTARALALIEQQVRTLISSLQHVKERKAIQNPF